MSRLSTLLFFAWCVFPLAAAQLSPVPEGFLRCKGIQILDQKDRPVRLRGINLGSWFLKEPWMCPMDSSGVNDDFSAREILARRFGEEEANNLLKIWEENWINSDDLDRIAKLGFNVVRLPIWYRTLQREDGTWLPDGFQRMDWLVNEAWKRGIYTVIDLHGLPGGQTDSANTGKKREKAGFWNNEALLQRVIVIWETIAIHYRGQAAVAAYDLINEPSSAPTLGALWSSYDRIYRAIRKLDPEHIITVEGCINTSVGDKSIGWGWDALPHPGVFGWKNTLYQLHHYEWKWDDLRKQKEGTDFIVSEWKKHQHYEVPVYLGEFNPMGKEEAWTYGLAEYDRAGMHWSFWSYKATAGTGTNGWGLYNPVKKMEAPDLQKDSLETIRRKWAAIDTATFFAPNPMIHRALETLHLKR